MVVRFFGALAWFFILFSSFVLLIAYANFPNDVLVYIGKMSEAPIYLLKERFFYLLLAFTLIINASLIGLKWMLRKDKIETERSQTGVGVVQIFFNLFFASSVFFFNILNSRENFNYSFFGFLIIVTGILLAASVIFVAYNRVALKK